MPGLLAYAIRMLLKTDAGRLNASLLSESALAHISGVLVLLPVKLLRSWFRREAV